MLRNVAAVAAPPVAAFELGVLAEVFGLDRTGDGLPGYDFGLAAVQPGLVPTTSGFAVQVEQGLDRLLVADLVAIPSWPLYQSPPVDLVTALQQVVARGARVLAVCSGAFLLAATGLLDGRRAATHWRYADELAARFPGVQVDPDVLYVDAGPVLTSAGTAAAIDVCLHLVREAHGASVANMVARRMVVAPHRAGGQAQFVETPVPAVATHDGLGAVLDWARARLAEPLSVDVLARQALMSARTFARRFAAETGTTPHRWLLEQRLRHAEQLLESSDAPVGEIARRSGLGSADTLRHHFARRRRTSPRAYRDTFRTTGGAGDPRPDGSV